MPMTAFSRLKMEETQQEVPKSLEDGLGIATAKPGADSLLLVEHLIYPLIQLLLLLPRIRGIILPMQPMERNTFCTSMAYKHPRFHTREPSNLLTAYLWGDKVLKPSMAIWMMCVFTGERLRQKKLQIYINHLQQTKLRLLMAVMIKRLRYLIKQF